MGAPLQVSFSMRFNAPAPSLSSELVCDLLDPSDEFVYSMARSARHFLARRTMRMTMSRGSSVSRLARLTLSVRSRRVLEEVVDLIS